MANPTGLRTISFNVSEQYDIQDVVGEGAYGVVWYVYALFRAAYWLTSNVRPYIARRTPLRDTNFNFASQHSPRQFSAL